MERTERMNTRDKNKMGLISFLPIMAYVAWGLHFIYLHAAHPEVSTSTLLINNYDATLLFFTICFILTSAVLVYFVVHIAKSKLMNGASKIAWIIFMAFAAPVAFPVFWYSEVRNEPEELPVHSSIA